MTNPLKLRRAGVILHPTSLPGPQACGSLGEQALRWIDWLAESGFGIWQFLPLTPVMDGSPYNSYSAFAGNPQLVDLQILQHWGFPHLPCQHEQPLSSILKQQFKWFEQHRPEPLWTEFQNFCREEIWLDDFCLFSTIKELQPESWVSWPAPLRDRDARAIADFLQHHQQQIQYHRFVQFLFFRQWKIIKDHARARNIVLFGDLPIFVAHDSADVWCHRHLFKLDESGNPLVVAGVPPDYFSETGQRWGNPLYEWQQHETENFNWWKNRINHSLRHYDAVRIDHFRGFVAGWEIPTHETTAINGRWVAAPGEALFEQLQQQHNILPLVAEDLGTITPEVVALRKKFNLPGMKILQFAFDSDSNNPYLPHQHSRNSVVYTGTHDNDTTCGWHARLTDGTRNRLAEYYGHPADPMPWPLIRSALASPARWAMLPLQDLLALGSEHRMNIPGTVEGNWRWRFDWSQIPPELAQNLRQMNQLYQRCN